MNAPVKLSERMAADAWKHPTDWGWVRLDDYASEVAALEAKVRALEQQAERWIPVSERLPEAYATVAMSEDGHTAGSGFINDDGKWYSHSSGSIVMAPRLWFLLPDSSAIQNAAERVTK